jgi:hypothetical protein
MLYLNFKNRLTNEVNVCVEYTSDMMNGRHVFVGWRRTYNFIYANLLGYWIARWDECFSGHAPHVYNFRYCYYMYIHKNQDEGLIKCWFARGSQTPWRIDNTMVKKIPKGSQTSWRIDNTMAKKISKGSQTSWRIDNTMVKKIPKGSQTSCVWLPFDIFLAIVLSIFHDVWLPFGIFLAIVLSILHDVWLPLCIFLTIVLSILHDVWLPFDIFLVKDRQYNGQEDTKG